MVKLLTTGTDIRSYADTNKRGILQIARFFYIDGNIHA